MGLRRLTSLRPGARAHAITGILRLRSLMLLVAQMLAQLSVQRRLQHVFRQLAEQSARAHELDALRTRALNQAQTYTVIPTVPDFPV